VLELYDLQDKATAGPSDMLVAGMVFSFAEWEQSEAGAGVT
jgi:hypothetical protein